MDKEKFKAGLKETVETIVFVLVALVLIRFFIGELRWIPSGSMHPTLIEKDRIFVSKLTGFFTKPKRGDIYVFYPPMTQLENTPLKIFARYTGILCNDIAYIKRVIGLPGETLEIRQEFSGHKVFINGVGLDEDYILDPEDYTPCGGNVNCGPIKIPEGHYFMMGDNRGNSKDSRYWGTLPKDRLIGKATFIFWPITRVHPLINKGY